MPELTFSTKTGRQSPSANIENRYSFAKLLVSCCSPKCLRFVSPKSSERGQAMRAALTAFQIMSS